MWTHLKIAGQLDEIFGFIDQIPTIGIVSVKCSEDETIELDMGADIVVKHNFSE